MPPFSPALLFLSSKCSYSSHLNSLSLELGSSLQVSLCSPLPCFNPNPLQRLQNGLSEMQISCHFSGPSRGFPFHCRYGLQGLTGLASVCLFALSPYHSLHDFFFFCSLNKPHSEQPQSFCLYFPLCLEWLAPACHFSLSAKRVAFYGLFDLLI